MLENISKLIITQPKAELKAHKCYCNVLVLEEDASDEVIEESKEVLTKSVIEDIEKDGEIPIAILLSLKQNPCLHIDVWTKKIT